MTLQVECWVPDPDEVYVRGKITAAGDTCEVQTDKGVSITLIDVVVVIVAVLDIVVVIVALLDIVVVIVAVIDIVVVIVIIDTVDIVVVMVMVIVVVVATRRFGKCCYYRCL